MQFKSRPTPTRVILLIFSCILFFSSVASADVPIDATHFQDSAFRVYILAMNEEGECII